VCRGNTRALHQGLIAFGFTIIVITSLPPASPIIFPTQLCPAIHIHTEEPALFPAEHSTGSPVSPAHTEHAAVQFPGTIKHTAQVSI
jgi:hypothetical protein